MNQAPAYSGTASGPLPRQVGLLFGELSRLSELELAPADYYDQFLRCTLPVLGASAGAVWCRSPLGEVELIQEVALQECTIWHDDWAKAIFTQPQLLHVAPNTELPGTSRTANHHALLAPIVVDRQVVGVLELWEDPEYAPLVAQSHLQLLARLTEFAAHFTRQTQRRLLLEQQRLWTELEAFSHQVHGSLNPTEVAFLVANEARRLAGCDRVSVVLRRGRQFCVEAVSGLEVIEQRSNLIQRLRQLCERVMTTGETLVYAGVRDDGLPPKVFEALDAYVTESPSQLLMVLPLRDCSGEEAKPHAALVLECFESRPATEPLRGRLEVVGRHAASALGNAYRYQRIPMHRVGDQLAWVVESAGGMAYAIAALGVLALLGMTAMFCLVSYPLKIEAHGQLLPRERRWVYAPVEAQVIQFEQGVQPGNVVMNRQALMLLYDTQLELKLVQLNLEIAGTEQEITAMARQQAAAASELDRLRFSTEKKRLEFTRDRKNAERQALRVRTNADESRPGYFWLKAPLEGAILSWDFREKLSQRVVKPSDPLLRIGALDKRWEVELKIPQKHVGQLLRGFDTAPEGELDVDLLLSSEPTRTFKGKLARPQIAGEAVLGQDESEESEPVVFASVRLDGDDIAEAERIPADMLVTGTEVHSKVRCGTRAMGYSLFHGVWEFFYEKVVFFFQ